MSSNGQSNAFELRDSHYAGLYRDVMVYEALDDMLSYLALPSQGLRSLCHDEISSEVQAHMLRTVARLAADCAMLHVFEIAVANIALARRDWPLIAELGIHGISYDEDPPDVAPNGRVVTCLTMPAYYARAAWHFDDQRWIPRIHGEGRIEQVARHLTTSLIAIAATRHAERGAEQ